MSAARPCPARRAAGLLLAVAAAGLSSATPARAQAPNPARIVAERQLTPRVLELTIATPAFTAPTRVHVDLPAGYDADPARRWPVAYYTAGTNQTYASFNDGYAGERLSAGFPGIIVAPNGDSGYWSDWYNGGARGAPQYETYVIDQLLPLVDARFRTTGDRAGRAILGESMGGGGATLLAARHPDRFVAASTISGAVDSNIAVNGAVLSASPLLQGGAPDAIYGPRATQAIRWHGHNPTDLAANLRDVDLQVGSADGIPAPALGEGPADVPGCATERLVHDATVSFHAALQALRVAHTYRDYGAGCHSVPNFQRQITDTLAIFARVLAERRTAVPARFDHLAIEPRFGLWGWDVAADPARPLEVLALRGVGRGGLTLTGSGTTTVVTAPLFRGAAAVDVGGGSPARARPDAAGRVRFTVDLGPVSDGQQDVPGTTTRRVTRTVTLAPQAVLRITGVRAGARGVRVCARAVAGTVRARLTLRGTRPRSATFAATARCVTLTRTATGRGGRAALTLSGTDAFGHRVRARRTVTLRARRAAPRRAA